MPGISAADRVIEAAAELTDTISNFKHASQLKDVQDTHMAALNKLLDIFNGATRQSKQDSSKEVLLPSTQKTKSETPIHIKTTPAPRVVMTKQYTPVPRVNLPKSTQKEIYIIPEENNTKAPPAVTTPPTNAPHVIPINEDPWEKANTYIHKYNTRCSPRYEFAGNMFRRNTYTDYSNHVLHPTTGTAGSYRKLSTGLVPGQSAAVWKKSLVNEFGRLADEVGTRMPHGTNTIKFINRRQVPPDRNVTYGNVVCDTRPQKAETYMVR